MQSFQAQSHLPWRERQWTVGSAAGVRAGTRAAGVITHGTTADGTVLQNALHLLVGSEEGPVLYVQAAVHGDEVNNVEALRQVLGSLDPRQMRGVLIAIPVINGPAFLARRRQNPIDREDMNRVWPGKRDGSTSSQMAYNLYQQAIQYANYVIDLHTASSNYLLHVVYGAGDDASRELAKVFGLEILLEEEVDQKLKEARFQGKLRNVLNARGIPAITPELGGTNRIEPANVALGARGITNVMKHLGMLEGQIVLPEHRQITLHGSHLDHVMATKGGFWIPQIAVGNQIHKGDVLGHIYSLLTFDVAEIILAPYNGYVLGMPDSPVINFGDDVVTLSQNEG
ncbi:MAG TPA: succinylglutamate desuccinylase/aspartoacylase family protein [Ktedonobacteraceae bacterium]